MQTATNLSVLSDSLYKDRDNVLFKSINEYFPQFRPESVNSFLVIDVTRGIMGEDYLHL